MQNKPLEHSDAQGRASVAGGRMPEATATLSPAMG